MEVSNRIILLVGIGVLSLIIGIYIYSLYQLEQYRTETEEKIELIKEQLEEAKGKVVAWVQEFTNEDAELLFKEKDSSLYVVKAGKELYKVSYNFEVEEIEYALLKDEIVYER